MSAGCDETDLMDNNETATTHDAGKTFGTLILILPSVYKGGNYIAEDHEESVKELGDLITNAAYASHYVAFYHDCPTMRQQKVTTVSILSSGGVQPHGSNTIPKLVCL